MSKTIQIVTQAPFIGKTAEPMHEWHRWREHLHFGFGGFANEL